MTSHVLKGVDYFKLVDVAKDVGLIKQIVQNKNSIILMKNQVHTNRQIDFAKVAYITCFL